MYRKKSRKRSIITTSALVLALTVFMPLQSFAASELWIDDGTGTSTQHTTAASGSGSGGGTWNWNGADDLALDNYVGSEVSATGNLNIDVTGTNKVSAPATHTGGDTAAVWVEDGDATISGSGTLEATNDSSGYYASGIYVSEGNLTIDGTTVTATSTSKNNSALGIGCTGDLNIVNGANVTTSATSPDEAFGLISYYSNVNITNSTVSATGTGLEEGSGAGIFAEDYDQGIPVFINITNSKVTAKGSTIAMLAFSYTVPGSKINIKNSIIKTPANAHVQDLLVDNNKVRLYGQTIGTGTDTIDSFDSSDIVKNVLIVKNSVSTVAGSVTGSVANVLGVKTGDTSTNMFAWLGLMLIAMIAFVRIRSHANSLLCR